MSARMKALSCLRSSSKSRHNMRAVRAVTLLHNHIYTWSRGNKGVIFVTLLQWCSISHHPPSLYRLIFRSQSELYWSLIDHKRLFQDISYSILVIRIPPSALKHQFCSGEVGDRKIVWPAEYYVITRWTKTYETLLYYEHWTRGSFQTTKLLSGASASALKSGGVAVEYQYSCTSLQLFTVIKYGTLSCNCISDSRELEFPV
jgi:hypothetical protein